LSIHDITIAGKKFREQLQKKLVLRQKKFFCMIRPVLSDDQLIRQLNRMKSQRLLVVRHNLNPLKHKTIIFTHTPAMKKQILKWVSMGGGARCREKLKKDRESLFLGLFSTKSPILIFYSLFDFTLVKFLAAVAIHFCCGIKSQLLTRDCREVPIKQKPLS
jgi:hypothetical protein